MTWTQTLGISALIILIPPASAQAPAIQKQLDRLNQLNGALVETQSLLDAAESVPNQVLDDVPLVLMYHDIVGDAQAASSRDAALQLLRGRKATANTVEEPTSDVLRTDFQDQLAWLRNHGYTSVTIDQFYQAMVEYPHYKLPPKSVLLTFDDGYLDNRDVKEDFLKDSFIFGAVFFIHSHYTGQDPTPGLPVA